MEVKAVVLELGCQAGPTTTVIGAEPDDGEKFDQLGKKFLSLHESYKS